MIGFLKGRVHALSEEGCLLDVQGVGYSLLMSTRNISELKQGQELFIYTHLVVREDALLLCGFLHPREQDLFNKLISVSGIGMRGALAVLSTLNVDAFIRAIQTRDLKVLTGIPGVGKKTAERLLLELKGKFPEMPISATVDTDSDMIPVRDGSNLQDVTLALQSLGYDGSRALSVARAVYTPDMKVEECIKICLKELSRC